MSRRTATRASACQLSLLDLPEMKPEPAPQEDEMIMVPFGNQQVQLPLVIYRSSSYANGDTSPRAVEGLAETLIGDVEIVHYGPPEHTIAEKDRWKIEFSHSIPGYERYWYRCVSSGVVDGKAWGAYVYEKCCNDLTRWRNPYEDDDIE